MYRQLIYRIGECSLDVGARELRRSGEKINLSPRIFDCIVYLLEHRNRAVGQDELVSAVWGTTELADGAVRKAIMKARRALGDIGETPRLICTVPRFGYRWAYPVQEEGSHIPASESGQETAAEEPSETSGAPDAGAPRQVGWPSALTLAVAAGVTAMAVATAVTWVHSRTSIREMAPTREARAAKVVDEQPMGLAMVLPATVAGDPESVWLRLGLMDLIASRLRIGGLTVVPSSSVVALAGEDQPAPNFEALRTATHAQLLVLPSARRTANGWRVRLELHAPSGETRAVESHASDAIAASGNAVGSLLDLLSKGSPSRFNDTLAPSVEVLLQRAEAAVLGSDLSGARQLLESAPANLRELAEVRLRLAQLELKSGNYRIAEQMFRDLLAESPAETHPLLRASALRGVAQVLGERMHFDESLRIYTEAVHLLERQNDQGLLGIVYNGRGTIYSRMRQFDLAEKDYSRAQIAAGLAGDSLALARAELNQSSMESNRGRPGAALLVIDRAVGVFESFGALYELSVARGNEIQANLSLLKPESALEVLERSRQPLEKLENPAVRRMFDYRCAGALAANGRLGDARGLLAAILSNADPEEERWVIALAHAALANLELQAGRPQQALKPGLQAVAQLTDAEFSPSRAEAWLTLIRTLRSLGRDDVEETARFSKWAGQVGEPSADLHALLARAEEAERAEDHLSSTQSFAEAMSLAERIGVPSGIAAAAVAYGDALIARGDLANAVVVVGKISRWADQDFGSTLLRLKLYHALGQVEPWRTALNTAVRMAGERPMPKDAMAPPTRVASTGF